MLNAKEEKMTTRNQTKWHNLEFLKTDLKFSQLGNSAVFRRNGKFLISPAVSEGQHGKYWIDIREANLVMGSSLRLTLNGKREELNVDFALSIESFEAKI